MAAVTIQVVADLAQQLLDKKLSALVSHNPVDAGNFDGDMDEAIG